MTLERLLLEIGQVGIKDKLINFSCGGSSIFEINSLTIKEYPILYISPTGNHNVTENYTEFELTLYYIDRLLEDSSNDVNIHSVGIEALKNIINKIKRIDGVLDVSNEYTIILFKETEGMSDRCSGAYAQVRVTVQNGNNCGL